MLVDLKPPGDLPVGIRRDTNTFIGDDGANLTVYFARRPFSKAFAWQSEWMRNANKCSYLLMYERQCQPVVATGWHLGDWLLGRVNLPANLHLSQPWRTEFGELNLLKQVFCWKSVWTGDAAGSIFAVCAASSGVLALVSE
jgi:hypothetical protein